jgi:hypothetical protein
MKKMVIIYNTNTSYRNTKKKFLHTNLNIIAIFEISFEWIKIFLNGFHQKIARENTKDVFLLALKSDKYVLKYFI